MSISAYLNSTECKCGRAKLPGAWRCNVCLEESQLAQEKYLQDMKDDLQRKIPQYVESAGVPNRYRGVTVDGMDLIPARLRTILEDAAKKPRNLYFHGVSGSGKSHAAAAVLQAWMRKRLENAVNKGVRVNVTQPPAKFVIVPDFFASMRSAPYRESYRRGPAVAAQPFLVLDELGAEKTTDYTLDVLYQIVNIRYNAPRWKCHTIVTSNLSLQEVASKLHDRLASRLMGMCDVVIFPNKDLRPVVYAREKENETDENIET